MYCRALYHVTENCPQLISNWQEKRNANVQMIAVEACDEQPKIETIRCGGTRTREDVTNQGNKIHQWVRKATEPSPLFDPGKEKETY
jgi:hypothetical protein